MSASMESPPDGDRVRFCLSCGEVVPFDVRACPACGHYDAVPTSPTGPLAKCPSCDVEIAAALCFCPSCGRETAAAPAFPEVREVSRDGVPEDEPGAAGLLAAGVAWAAPLSVLGAMAYVLSTTR
jgi:predicted RNA-binding Zn-ribbon protein involved in translation (DUF1610 family)